MAEENQLITKYRPKSWGEVIGQDEVVKSLKSAISRQLSHVLLFTGPSGTGKTTLGRLVLAEIGCNDSTDYDAADLSGVDDIRGLRQSIQYKPIGGGKKGIIIDECHRLSRNAWDALLKVIEEPRDYLYWIFCTTQPLRIPDTIRTRCSSYQLKPVSTGLLEELLDFIANEEQLKCPLEVVSLCIKEARGSPRQAIANLSVCADIECREDAAKLLRSAIESNEAVNLAQMLIKGGDWGYLKPILEDLQDTDAESIRHVVRAYVTKAMLNGSGKDAAYLYEILDAFSQPFANGDGISPVLHAVGKIIFQRV